MATPEKLLSVQGGEALPKLDANKEDDKVQEVGGPSPEWSTANYANFKFDATLGVSPDSTVLPDAAVDAEKTQPLKEEGEVCSVCEQTPCACEGIKEQDDMVDSEKKDMMEEACPACGNEPCTCDGVKEQDAVPAPEEKPEDKMVEADAGDLLDTNHDGVVDSEDDTLDLDLADLMDGDGEVIELDSEPEEVSSDDEDVAVDTEAGDDFLPSDDEEVWSSDDEDMNVDVTSDDEEIEEGGYGLAGGLRGPKREEVDPAKADDAEKKDDVMSEQDGEDMVDDKEKKDVVTEQDDEEKKDEKDMKDAEPMAEGKLKISFKMDEAKKLFENNTVLTEADKRQSRALFESAVRSVAKQMSKQLQEAYQARYNAAKKQHETKVAAQVDQYLSYVVEQWAKDNKIALQNQLRNRLSESFITGLQKLFTEHYIDVPKSKVNVVEALAKNVKSLKVRLKESEAKAMKLHTEAKEAITRERLALRKEHKARLIAEAASAVTSSDRGAFVERAETVKFTNTKEFKTTLVALREQYFGAKKSIERSTNEPVAAPNFEPKKKPSSVDVYAEVASRLTGRS